MMDRMRRLGARVFEFWWGRGIADDVPALAYYLLLSLGPFALGVAAVQALLLVDVVSALQVATQINRFLPNAVHGDVQQLIVNARANSPLLLALAIASMLWTSSGAIGVIERCESRILECRRHDVITGRIRNLGLGALVGVAFVVSSGSAPVIGEAASLFDLTGALPGGLLFLLNAFGSVVMFAVIYRYAPRSPIGWKPAFLGALPAGLAIQGIPALVGLYFGAAAGFAAVRLFLLLAVLLLGLYVMATVMLVGAGIASSRENRRRNRPAHLPELPGTPEALIHHRGQADRAPAVVLSKS
jgi:YihY family inner membrane protein